MNLTPDDYFKMWGNNTPGDTVMRDVWDFMPIESRVTLAYLFGSKWPANHIYRSKVFNYASNINARRAEVYRPFLRFLKMTVDLSVESGASRGQDALIFIDKGTEILAQHGAKKFVQHEMWPE